MCFAWRATFRPDSIFKPANFHLDRGERRIERLGDGKDAVTLRRNREVKFAVSLDQFVPRRLLAACDEHVIDSSRPIVALCCHERFGEGQLLVKHSSLVSFERERGRGNGGHVGGHVGVLSRLDGGRLGV